MEREDVLDMFTRLVEKEDFDFGDADALCDRFQGEVESLRTQLAAAQSLAEIAEAQKDETEQVCALIAHVIWLLERGEINKALIHLGALLNANACDKESRDAA